MHPYNLHRFGQMSFSFLCCIALRLKPFLNKFCMPNPFFTLPNVINFMTYVLHHFPKKHERVPEEHERVPEEQVSKTIALVTY